jgi:hypothetical protein
MPRVIWSAVLLIAGLLTLAGCSSTPERQWYKPGPYTVAEFRRDSEACMKDGRLDEACLRARGWVPLSGDPKRTERPTEPRPPGAVRY